MIGTPADQATTRLVNAVVDPLANIVVQLLALLATKGVIAKEEAIGCIASASAVLDGDGVSDEDGDAGRDVLMEMVKVLDRAIEPERPLTEGLD